MIAGERDRRYCDQATRMAAAIGPTATLSIVRDAGHACHLERPQAVAATIANFCTVSQAIEEGTARGPKS